MTVFVDRIVDRRRPVAVVAADRAKLAADPVIRPEQVVARGASATLERLEQQRRLVAELDFGAALAGTAAAAGTGATAGAMPTQPGPHELPAVPIKPVEGVTWDPPTVAVTVQVQPRSEKEYVIPSMVVNVRMPLSLQGRYRVRGPETVPNVAVRGPGEAIDAVAASLTRPGGSPPVAVLAVGPEDVGRDEFRRRLAYANLPPGVRVVNDDLEVTVRVVPTGDEGQ